MGSESFIILALASAISELKSSSRHTYQLRHCKIKQACQRSANRSSDKSIFLPKTPRNKEGRENSDLKWVRTDIIKFFLLFISFVGLICILPLLVKQKTDDVFSGKLEMQTREENKKKQRKKFLLLPIFCPLCWSSVLGKILSRTRSYKTFFGVNWSYAEISTNQRSDNWSCDWRDWSNSRIESTFTLNFVYRIGSRSQFIFESKYILI